MIKGIQADRQKGFLVTGNFILPVTISLIISVFVSFYSDQTTRYLLFSQPFLMLLFSVGIQNIRTRKIRKGLLFAIIILFCTALYPLYFMWDRVGFGEFDKAAQKLREMVKPQDSIVSAANAGLPIAYYLRDGLASKMIIRRKKKATYPQTERIWIVNMHDRSMLESLKGPLTMKDLIPPAAPFGYRLAKHEILHSRKPISLTLYERVAN